MIGAMERYSSFARTSIGASHISRGMICQDFSLAADNESCSFAAAADGHGSLCYLRTDRGSRFASFCAQECIGEFLEGIGDAHELLDDDKHRQQLMSQLWRSIIARWHDMAERDFYSEPFTDEELNRIPEKNASYRSRYEQGDYISAYGTTLLFSAVTESFVFGAQIGDGRCVVLGRDGAMYAPIPDDPRCYDNVTTSMCQDDAALSARFFYLSKEELPAAIFLCTDGVENSYGDDGQLFGFFRGLALTIAENGLEEGVRQLEDFLPVMTRRGSGDDVSCAGIIDMEAVTALADVLREAVAAYSSSEAETPAAEENDSIDTNKAGGNDKSAPEAADTENILNEGGELK